MTLKGRIKSIYKEENTITYVTQGVKKADQYKYNHYSGGNGSYVTDSDYERPDIIVEYKAYDSGRLCKQAITNEVLEYNSMKRISPQLLNWLKENNEGVKIKLNSNDTFDISEINIAYKG